MVASRLRTLSLLAFVVVIVSISACGLVPFGEGEGEGDGNEGEGEEGEGEVEFSGDVWVDAEDVVVGEFRAFVDNHEDAVESLVDADGVVWRVFPSHDGIGAVDSRDLTAWYESDDCSGDALIEADVFGFGFRDGITTGDSGGGGGGLAFVPNEIVVLRSGSTTVERVAGSAVTGGCFTADQFVTPVPSTFYVGADFDVVRAPAFTAPLRIERR